MGEADHCPKLFWLTAMVGSVLQELGLETDDKTALNGMGHGKAVLNDEPEMTTSKNLLT